MFVVTMLTACGTLAIAINFVQEHNVLVTCFGGLLASGVSVGVLNTIAVDLFPTHYR